LDLVTDQGLHLIMHLARAGWLRWRDDLPTAPPKPGKSPLAFRLRLDDGSGFDLTEQGTHKLLAVYLVRDSAEVPGVATLGPGRPGMRGVRRHDQGGLVRRFLAAVLPDLPDRRQATGRPPPVPPAQVVGARTDRAVLAPSPFSRARATGESPVPYAAHAEGVHGGASPVASAGGLPAGLEPWVSSSPGRALTSAHRVP